MLLDFVIGWVIWGAIVGAKYMAWARAYKSDPALKAEYDAIQGANKQARRREYRDKFDAARIANHEKRSKSFTDSMEDAALEQAPWRTPAVIMVEGGFAADSVAAKLNTEAIIAFCESKDPKATGKWVDKHTQHGSKIYKHVNMIDIVKFSKTYTLDSVPHNSPPVYPSPEAKT